ncbi:MAG TPA: prolyl oligopeptidase family serine peptidase [Vicinamibacterales bacterium]|nr:prolyl oligopeptidase family serine peptidase [Vicinamibacterales bacterium]
MRQIFLLVALCAGVLAAQPSPRAQGGLSIETLMSAPFPTELVASPAGGRFAWIASASGVQNLWVAEPPGYAGRAVTTYTADDGQWLSQPAWLADGTTLVYTRGDGPNRQGDSPNPAQLSDGAEQAIWAVSLSGGAPRRLGPGNAPAPAPKGSVVAWISRGQIFTSDLAAGDAKPTRLVASRGTASSLRWSPDGAALAFVSNRGTHSFLGLVTPGSRELRYLDPSLDRDSNPAWSPDGTRLAYTRELAAPRPQMFAPRRTADEPWTIRVVDVKTGGAREVWKADPGYGSVLQPIDAENQILWAAGDRLVFPWEKYGWLHLYSVPAAGGEAAPLSPGDGEVEYASLTPDRTRVLYHSNHKDIDRKHLWLARVDGAGVPSAVTTGAGIEWSPVMAETGTVTAFFRSDARTPPHVEIKSGEAAPRMVQGTLPTGFPASQLVEPQPVIVTATDGMPIHAQLFLPKDLKPGERRPSLIFSHGGSRRQMLLGWHYMYYYRNAYAMNQWLASRGYIVLSVNYRSGIGYGLEFREALNFGATGGSEFQDIMGAGLYLKSRPDVDPARIGLWGGSYGGYLTAMGLSRASNLFAAGVDFHGVHDWNQGIRTFRPDYNTLEDPDFARKAFAASPLSSVDTWKSPVLLIHGDDDRNVSFIESINLITALRKRGVEVEQLVFPDEVHDFLRHASWVRAYQATADFFDRRLKGRAESSSAARVQ